MGDNKAFKSFLNGFTRALTDFSEEVEKQAAFAEVISSLEHMKLHPARSGAVVQVFRPLDSAYEPSEDDQDEGLPAGIQCQEVTVNVALDPDEKYEHRIKAGTFGDFDGFPNSYIRDNIAGEVKNNKCQITVLSFSYI